MQRRDVLRALTAGLAVSAIDALEPDRLWATARAVHDRLGPRAQDRDLTVLTEHQHATVTAIAELIIPETDTPGATAAGVPRFVDLMLAEWFTGEERDEFLGGLVALDARSTHRFGAAFVDLDEPQQITLLSGLDAEVSALRDADLPTDEHFFRRMKWLTLYGYYTSEIGATVEQNEVLLPGRYEPCAPVRKAESGVMEW
jgi:hypothetical protein